MRVSRQAESAPHTAAEQSQASAQRTRFTDARASSGGIERLAALAGTSPAVTAQRRLAASMNHPDSSSARGLRHSTSVIQAKFIDGLDEGAALDVSRTVYFKDGPKAVPQMWEIPMEGNDSRADLMQAIAAKAGETGNSINRLVGKKVNVPNPEGGGTKKVVPGWNPDPNTSADEEVVAYDPLRVRFSGQYGEARMELDYHFGELWSGYVIHVTDSEMEINKEMFAPPPRVGPRPPPGQRPPPPPLPAGHYRHVHDVDGGAAPGVLAASDSADAATKVAGEGARWQCIGSHAGTVRDDSRIYTNLSADAAVTPQVRYVTFPNLWKSWVATFDKAFGIDDDTVAEKLTEPNIRINTMDGEVDHAVAAVESSTMRHGIDISVDDTKPAGQGQLDAESVQYVFIKKTGPAKVVESAQTLGEENTAARTALGNVAGVHVEAQGGYVGNDVFAFKCTTGDAANLAQVAGYTHQTAKRKTYSYPIYRREYSKGKIGQSDEVKAIKGGTNAYETEKDERYDALKERVAADLARLGIVMPEGGVQSHFICHFVIPWEGVEKPLPAVPAASAGNYTEPLKKYRDSLAKSKTGTKGAAKGKGGKAKGAPKNKSKRGF